MIFGGLVFSTLYFVGTDNMYVYTVMTGMGYLGYAIFKTVIWAAIIEVVDNSGVTTHNRQEGAVYSPYSFAHKADQVFDGFISGQALATYERLHLRCTNASVRRKRMDLYIRDSSTGYFIHAMRIVVLQVHPVNRKCALNKAVELGTRRKGK